MTYNEFKNKYLGKVVDYDKAYNGQCWDLAQQYITECLGLPASIISGVGLVNNLLKEPKLSLMKKYFDVVPLNQKIQGDIEVWDYGHIAIMDHWDASKGLNVYLTQNSGTAEKPIGGVYLGAIADNPNCMAFRVKKKEPTELEKANFKVNELQKQVELLNKQLADKSKELETSNNTISEKMAEIALKQQNIMELENKINSDKTKIEIYISSIDELHKEREILNAKIGELNTKISELENISESDYKEIIKLGNIVIAYKRLG